MNLKKNGYLERQTREQTYCEGCAKFLADRFIEGTCPKCGADVRVRLLPPRARSRPRRMPGATSATRARSRSTPSTCSTRGASSTAHTA
jgi:methionyl-tRNA synthetase